MTEIVSTPQHGDRISERDGRPTNPMRLFMDDLTERLNMFLLGNRVVVPSHMVANLPDATKGIGVIFVPDETGGSVLAFSDGTNWRRCTDRNIVS